MRASAGDEYARRWNRCAPPSNIFSGVTFTKSGILSADLLLEATRRFIVFVTSDNPWGLDLLLLAEDDKTAPVVFGPTQIATGVGVSGGAPPNEPTVYNGPLVWRRVRFRGRFIGGAGTSPNSTVRLHAEG